jgi:nucleotide-binding universal stress UspA family protein
VINKKPTSVTSWIDAMKSILLPVDQSEQMPSALECAWHLANLFEGTVEGVALRPAFAEIVAPDPIVAVTIPPADWNEVEFTRNVRQRFDAFAAAHAQGGARFRWRGGSAVEDSALGSLARVYDVTVLSRPGSRGSRMTALEAVLFDSGRPLLMAPPTPPKGPIGQTVLIHWNASTETARVILDAMPILRKAKRVSFIAIEGHISPGPSIKDAVAHLEANGIAATDKTVPNSKPGEAILAEAAAIGADLLIKGAYTQSRLRQMIFGGATSHIRASAELPVLLAH